MECKYNSFTKKQQSKTAFSLNVGHAIFSETLYLLQPLYIHKRSPALTLVSKGKHLTGLFPISEQWLIGDHSGKTILVYLKDLGFDLFLIDSNLMQTKNRFLLGQLNDVLFEARKAA
ncbi:MAG: hypothetical protein O9302_08725 [Cyclobacteriaceae bacterium]|jgi:hypothetical protein|nr:hypothetical protein [Cytophagales bacterium]MCZ8328128.1 hypothetical protein [Cyclobacteriaceae bacterium]